MARSYFDATLGHGVVTAAPNGTLSLDDRQLKLQLHKRQPKGLPCRCPACTSPSALRRRHATTIRQPWEPITPAGRPISVADVFGGER